MTLDALTDPRVLALVLGAALAVTLFLTLIALLARRGQAKAAEATRVEAAVAGLSDAHQRLSARLDAASETAARGQMETIRLVETRLDAVAERLSDRLGGAVAASAQATERSLGALGARLDAIDRAQSNLERLSSDVLGLQDILSNKQARGAFGEVQLADLVSAALPPDAYALQAPLANGRRVDALLKLPAPPGPIAVDAKFPLEAFEALRRAEADGGPASAPARQEAARAFRKSVQAHIAAIADRYVSPGETADGALMFLPSEAVYAELHANFAELVREGFRRRVWIVSPTTLMATLTTMRAILRDARLREETEDLRRDLAMLSDDLTRLRDRVTRLGGHFRAAEKDLREVETSTEKSLARLRRLGDAETPPSTGDGRDLARDTA